MKNEPFVSFIIPTFNVEKYITKVLNSIKKQKYSAKRMEVIVVDDNSTDRTVEKVKKFQKKFPNFKLFIKKPFQPKGAAISTNIGIKKSEGELIALVDADAVLASNWLKEILSQFRDPGVGMVAGVIRTANPENLWAAFMGRELEDRYLAVRDREVDHVSTCNTVYRRKLFDEIGMFNENLYYGYDVDFSYRVRKAGYKILLLKNIYCLHYWKESFKSCVKQLYHTGYARLKILEKFPDRRVGGKISGWKLIVQIPLTLGLLLLLPFILLNEKFFYLFTSFLFLVLVFQFPQAIRIIKRHRDFRFIFFPFFLVLRNIVWVWSFINYNIEKLKIRRLFI